MPPTILLPQGSRLSRYGFRTETTGEVTVRLSSLHQLGVPAPRPDLPRRRRGRGGRRPGGIPAGSTAHAQSEAAAGGGCWGGQEGGGGGQCGVRG